MLLAGLCPPLIGVLTGAGTGRRHDEKEKKPEYDLSRFGKGKPGRSIAAKPQVTEQDLEHVRELDAELERRLAAARATDGTTLTGAAASGPADADNRTKPEQPVQKLSAGPLEAPAIDDKPKKPKRYGGEFYPTETHVKPAPDEEK